MNVAHILPPSNILSEVGSKYSIRDNLSSTFAPPNKRVLFSFFISSNSCNSLSTRKPTACGKYEGIPTVEACLLCEEAKASNIYTSPRLAQYFDNSMSQLLSNLSG